MVADALVCPTIKLDPTDWMLATWRPYIPLPRPSVVPFDQHTACERLSKARGDYYVSWKSLRLSPAMTREEAHFWLIAMAYHYEWQHKATHAAMFLANQTFDGNISLVGTEKLITDTRYFRSGPELIIPIANLLPLPDLITLLVNITSSDMRQRIAALELIAGFREYVLPYLTPDERALARNLIREQVENSPALPSNSRQAGTGFMLYLAAMLGGFSQQIEMRLAALPDGFYHQPNVSPYLTQYLAGMDLILGLDNPALVEREARRLGHTLWNPNHVAGWLAHTETKALDWIYESIVIAHKAVAEPLFKVFTQVEDEAAVPHILKLQHDSPVVLHAVEWLRTHPVIAAHGAATVFTAHNTDPKTTREARNYLLSLRRSDHTVLGSIHLDNNEAQARYEAEILNAVIETVPPLTDENTPTWLADAVHEIQQGKRAKLAAWLDIGDLSLLRLDDHAFNRDQVNALLIALSRSKLDAPHPFVKAVKTQVDAWCCDAFVWSLFELWLDRGAPSKDRWAITSIGLLGNDTSVMKLTPLIRKWPGESQHQRATLGLACLRAIGTDTALTQINNIGQKVQFNALKTAARNAIEAIAAERGMNREELADRIVPDCGLDADGRRTFSYGTRQFTLVINSELKPVIRLDDGKLKPDLPKPTTQDDPEQVSVAQADWKLIKKQVRDVAKAQAERLENAMMSRRLWTPENFKRFLVDHPLMTHLVRSLVWGGYDQDRRLICTFRVTDEKDYADVEDDLVTLDGVSQIGLVHPLQLAAGEIAAWGQVLSDYDRVPPFTQLSRKTYALDDAEKETTEITRYAQLKIEAVVLIGVLQKLGWVRGAVGDGGMYYEHAKPFYANTVTAVIQYPGVPMGYLVGWQDQVIEHCFFVPGIYKPDDAYPKHENLLKLGDVDPVVMSEVLRDLALLSHKSGK